MRNSIGTWEGTLDASPIVSPTPQSVSPATSIQNLVDGTKGDVLASVSKPTQRPSWCLSHSFAFNGIRWRGECMGSGAGEERYSGGVRVGDHPICLLEVCRESMHVLVVRQDGVRLRAKKVAIPNAHHGKDHCQSGRSMAELVTERQMGAKQAGERRAWKG